MNLYCLASWRLLAMALLVASSSSHLVAQVNDQNPKNETVLADGDFVEVVVPTVDGTLVWKDVSTSLASSLSLDAPSVERMFPTGSLDLRSPTTMLALFGIDLALGEAISIQMTQDAAGMPALRFRCNKKSLGFITPQVKQIRPANIQLDHDWKTRTEKLPLVVCFHGLKSRPAKFDEFRNFIRQSGFATAAVSYDDHQSIADSAGEIYKLAQQLFDDAPPALVLIGHSMGGLVARELTENPKYAGPKIKSLITVATPHGGSNWASLPPLLDLFAEGKVDSGDLVDVILHRPSAPGLRDLAPQSPYLTELHQRKIRPNIRYTTIIGTGSPVTQDEVNRLRSTLLKLDQDGSVVRLIRPRIQPLLHSFDELVQGKGDGVVAAVHATIQGVDDIVTVPLSHVDMFTPLQGNQPQPVWSAILERIEQ
ncbi:alpha/beta fold hydrolase [Planctomycetes bacterium K23_9]|uniref:PGAP1-like protein n=1 Tax=Stieleria marina TaxID=1930275 RepID=A0A517NPL4_9BACT|nr:PGAP1-like protein [Planctomycetes bacterium K23_9]